MGDGPRKEDILDNGFPGNPGLLFPNEIPETLLLN